MRRAFYLSRLLEPLGLHVKLANSRDQVKEKLQSLPQINIVIIEEQSLSVLNIIASKQRYKHAAVILLSRNPKHPVSKVSSDYADFVVYIPCPLKTLLNTIINGMQKQNSTQIQFNFDKNNGKPLSE